MRLIPPSTFSRSGLLRLLVFIVVTLTIACQSIATQPALSPSPTVPISTPSMSPSLQPSTPTPFLEAPDWLNTPINPTAQSAPTAPPKISLLFTGQIVPGRCVQSGVDTRGNADYLYDNVRDLISQADLAITTINGTISDASPKTGWVYTFILVGASEHADAMARAGFDGASVATNHIKNCKLSNCGDRTFWGTLENLKRVGIVPIGAGRNLADAMQPAVFTIKGVRFAIVSLGEIESSVFATQEKAGIAVLNEQNLRVAIAEARKVADVVIVMPHWGPEYSAVPNWNQRKYAKIAVEAGANLIVGNHPHTVQGLQEINGVPVFYGLGNFVFDQFWSLEVSSSVILQVNFEGANYKGYTLTPVISKMDGTVYLADEAQAKQILAIIEKASQDLH